MIHILHIMLQLTKNVMQFKNVVIKLIIENYLVQNAKNDGAGTTTKTGEEAHN